MRLRFLIREWKRTRESQMEKIDTHAKARKIHAHAPVHKLTCIQINIDK